MMDVAIIGCGKIAESHAKAILDLPDAKLVATCDSEILMAKQLAERFGAKKFYNDLDMMLKEVRPDVVHVTTPPKSHFEIGRACLDAGCHVLIEKPFTVNTDEAIKLISQAKSMRLKLTVGTDEQFTPAALEMRKLIANGWLGGGPVVLDVYYCYDLEDERYAKAFLKNRSHWLWQLPGQLIQNIIPHAVMKICEFLDGDNVKVIATGFTSKTLRNLGELELKDELRAIILDEKQNTAYLTFSSQIKPSLKQLRIFGPKNGLFLEHDHHALIKIIGKNYISYLDKFVPLNNLARQYRKNVIRNAGLLLKKQFQMKSGLYNLIRFFYKSIEQDISPPISYDKILLCTKIIDLIIEEIYNK